MASENGSERFIFVGPYIHSVSPKELEFVEDGIIVVCHKNIVHVQKHSNNLAAVQKQFDIANVSTVKLVKGQFLIPGFVDTHIHGSQYPNIGLGYDLPLLGWLQKYTFPLEKRFAENLYAERIYNAVIKKTLANGTTTAVYFATIHREGSLIFANCVKNLGQRAFIGKVNMNKNTPSGYGETFEGSISSTRNFIHSVMRLKSDLVKPIITPRFALSCDMPLMMALGKLAAEYDLHIQTHISENLDEISLVKQEFPKYQNYLDVYNKAGLISDKTILAHGIHLEPEEVSKIIELKATISHCPSSNTLLRSGVCPVRKYLNAGVKVSLGTDCSGGSSPSMLECIRQAIYASINCSFTKDSEELTIDEVFYMATLGGAAAVHLDDVVGNFTTGKEFDAILVDLNNGSVDLLEEYNLAQLFQKFIYLADDRAIKSVFVAGKEVKQV